MIINHNMQAMNTHRAMGVVQGSQAKSMEKLSSGYRINRAGDDAAGLAISEKMRAQIKGLDQASRNSQDAISLVQTAEGALNETQNILQRMRELSVQSANDTNVAEDRTAIQNEIDQLVTEIDRIGDTTEFNTRKLLNGGAGIQGTSSDAGVSIVGGTADTQVVAGATLTLANADTSKAATLEYSLNDAADLTGGSFVLNNQTVTFANGADQAGDLANIIAAVNTVTDKTGVTATANGANLVLTTSGTGSSSKIELSGWDAVADDGANTQVSVNGAAAANSAATASAVGANASTGALGGTAATGASVTANGDVVTVHGGEYDGLQFKVSADAAGATTLAVTANGSLSMQIGANEGQDLSVSLNDMRATALGVNAIDITSSDSAKAAITTINDAITTVSDERAKLGAVQNRLEHTIANLDTSAENLQASESRIRDVDMAAEMMEFTKNNILSQAAQSMLAQANQAPQGVLSLLR